MNRLSIVLLLASISLLTLETLPALAQQPGRADDYSPAAPAPTVSPYVNLGFNTNGLSNYQSLIRPMLDSREAATHRTTRIHPARTNVRGASQRREIQGPAGPPESSVSQRFLNYSHYYGVAR